MGKAPPAQILIVDDDLPVCKSIAKSLEREDYHIDTVLSGEEALQRMSQQSYHLVITDLMMPGISGLELLRNIRNVHPGVMVLMITGYPSIRAAVESIRLGAFDYLPKPFTPEEIRGQVARALARQLLQPPTGPAEEPAAGRPHILRYSIPENAWAELRDDGTVDIGAHRIFLLTIDGIQAIEFPQENEVRYQGDPCLKIKDAGRRLHTLWMPVSGKILAINRSLGQDLSGLISDPYGEKWLMRVAPSNWDEDIKNLQPFA